jgi:transcription antitermination factor NusG
MAESNITGATGWNVVYTRHQHERFVAEALRRNGFEVFFPTYTVIRRWTDRKKYLSLPLFPCYVFLRSCFEQRWNFFATPGMHSLVMFGGSPAWVSELEIDAIRLAVESTFRVEPHPFLSCGDWVRIKSGPLAGLEGILVRKKGISRLILSLEPLGKSVAVEVDALSVQPLSHRAAGRFTSSTRMSASVDHGAVG